MSAPLMLKPIRFEYSLLLDIILLSHERNSAIPIALLKETELLVIVLWLAESFS